MDVVEALAAEEAVTCVVGAGGKKTTMYRLAGRLDRAAVTATVRIPRFDRQVADVVVTDDPVGALRAARTWPVGVVPERERSDRYLGYDTETVDRIADAEVADSVLVKADGARMRAFKAPADHEPQLPDCADVVVPVVSAQVVGEPLGEDLVHRVDRVAAVTGLRPGEPIEPADVATVLASPDGGRKSVPEGAEVIPLVNQVDDESLAATGREIARAIHERAPVSRVVLSQMTAPDPLVAVVE